MCKRIAFAAAVIITAALFFSCTQEKIDEVQIQHTEPVEKTHWLYFQSNDDGSFRLKPATALHEVPEVSFVPWTEAVRTADFAITGSQPLFLINKCGLFTRDRIQENMQLSLQHELFSRASAGGLYQISGKNFVRVYQNSLFIENNRQTNEYFLLQNDGISEFHTPAAKSSYLQLASTAQCTALEYANDAWYLSFKNDTKTDVSFTYLCCKDFSHLFQNDAYKYAEIISSEEFRDACEPQPYEAMPRILKELADTIEHTAPVYIRVFTKEMKHAPIFLKQPFSSVTREEKIMEAKALAYTRDNGTHCAAILMPDGKLYFNISEYGIQAVHLPPLPQNFMYSHFFITDTEILAAWEETSFYEVGRTGFFTALLSELL